MKLFREIRLHYSVIFFVSFILTALVQTILWYFSSPVDVTYWTHAINVYSKGDPIAPNLMAFGYPGAPIIVLGKYLVLFFGLSLVTALKITLIFWFSLAASACTTIAYLLRPKTYWWIMISVIYICSIMQFSATPPSILIMPLIPLLILLTLYIYENTGKKQTYALIAFVLVSALSIATRFDISILTLIFSAILLYPVLKKKTWSVTIAIALASYACIPFIWFSPLRYMFEVIAKIRATGYGTMETADSFFGLLGASPLSIVSFFLLILGVCYFKKSIGLSKRFIIWILVYLIVAFIILMNLHYNPVWYFHPLFCVLEVFLPLLIISITQLQRPLNNTPPISARLWMIIGLGAIFTFVSCNAFIYIFWKVYDFYRF